jgi:hypothetical protein
MITKACEKGIGAWWIQGSADAIPLRDGAVSYAFGVYVLHHLSDMSPVFRECRRVIGRGTVAFVTASHQFIARHPMNRYFPSFAKVDQARFQPIDEVAAALIEAGATSVGVREYVDAPRPIGPEYVERVANRFISTYDLIPEEEFREGLARLRADVEKTGQLSTPMVWESVVVWAEMH